MLELKECCQVPFPEKLFEGYEVTEKAIYANVNASKVMDMMKHFIETHPEPLFFILEIPANKADLHEIEPGLVSDLPDDVYYIDGCDRENALQCLEAVGPFLIRDGLNTFGFGGHESNEEMLFGRYNIMTVYTADAAKYAPFFASFGIEPTDRLVTAWDTFDQDHPGECKRFEVRGFTIYDIPEMYKEYGMYRAEQCGEQSTDTSEDITPDELIGKIMLVGITYYVEGNTEPIEQKQFWGTVTEVNEALIRIKRPNGEILTLPPDLRSTKRARQGKYTLHSTGETVKDPDFLATWNVTSPQND